MANYDYTLKEMREDYPMWVGFDLDGTLAHYSTWQGPHIIGKPIPRMVKLLREEIERGKREGFEVRIFTARACVPTHIPYIRQWLKENDLPNLTITCVKDHGCRLIYDDRVIPVKRNEGELLI